MQTTTISPNRHIKLEYRTPSSGFVEFKINATNPVKSYVLGPKSYEAFVAGNRNFRYYGGYPDPRKMQNQKIRIPFSGKWFLVIVNPDETSPVHVSYEVYY